MDEDGSFTLNSMPQTPQTDFDLMDELLYDGFWLEATDGYDFCPNIDSDFTNPQQGSFPKLTVKSNFSTEATLNNNVEMDEFFSPQSQDQEDDSPLATQSTKLWFGPNKNSIGHIPVKKRLMQAMDCLKESLIDKDILVQIWIPVNRGGRQVLTTNDQPFSLNPHCKNLAVYRNVSENYHFSADKDAKEFFGLPGRVFLNRFPDWTPDVRFFKREEYPRVKHAQQHDVRGSIALPVFEHGSGVCLGVVEIVTTSQKVDFSPELESVCKALEAVNLKSSEISIPSNVKDPNEPFQDFVLEVQNVLKYICDTHKLPLAQTWVPCSQQHKGICRKSNENLACCISILDSACYIADEHVLGFHEACSGYHLLKSEGIVGKAFTSNRMCFAEDIRTYSKTEYPLAHHARIFNLCASGAIRVRRSAKDERICDFVLEFFLNQENGDAQKVMLDSFSSVVLEKCRSLRVITDEELARETFLFGENDMNLDWIVNGMDSEEKGKGLFSVSLADHEEKSEEECNTWNKYKTSGRNKRAKMKNTITLEVLRQHYGGSLKEAAMNIGVCPTTLKRICRQHGITRWPSRKIKKVGHSLKKLQVVIDSVEGAHSSIQLDSFYNNFPQLISSNPPESSNFSTPNITTVPISTSSSSYCLSNGLQKGERLKRAQSEAKLHENTRDRTKQILIRSNSHKNLREYSPVETRPVTKNNIIAQNVATTIRVKASLGDENVRFKLKPMWDFKDLQEEVFRRFEIGNGSLKYLDDDAEWVLLACDEDLEECIDIHRSFNMQTVRLSVSQPQLGSSLP
ncbi:plant regulator RWP-RK family protein [Striga asiatica]|uniref:Plant regulator RWP-RK family protein n=1 Tax=Striga asiatica TaxID=4170 RepID=A0A5A7RKN2_STRAF|nr:plant regulator RWP-RK family protein [Striga asiatica]